MSEYTFNIADYREASPLQSERFSNSRAGIRNSNGLSEFGLKRISIADLEVVSPRVVDIRSLRDPQRLRCSAENGRAYQRRAKVLRFTTEKYQHARPLPATSTDKQGGSDGDPLNFPPAA